MVQEFKKSILTKTKMLLTLIGVSMLSVGCFDKVANVHEYQYSGFIYDDKADIVVNLSRTNEPQFVLYTPNSQAIMLQAPKDYTTRVVATNVLDVSKDGQNKVLNLKSIKNGQDGSHGNVDIYQSLDDALTNNSIAQEAGMILNDEYNINVSIIGDKIAINADDFNQIIYYGNDNLLKSEKIGGNIYSEIFSNKATTSEKQNQKSPEIYEDYFFITKQGLTQSATEEITATSLGNVLLRIDVNKIKGEVGKYKVTVIEYKINPDDNHDADKIQIFAPHNAEPVESFLIAKDKSTLVFSKNQPEEKSFFDSLKGHGIIRQQNKPQDLMFVEATKRGVPECHLGATCVRGEGKEETKEVTKEIQKEVNKLYQKAVGQSILSQIDIMNQRLYFTGVVLDESADVSVDDNSNGLPVSNQHLNLTMENGEEYALRPLQKYLLQYVDGTHQTVYSLSRSAIDYLNHSDNPNQKATFSIERPPQRQKPLVFLTALSLTDNAKGASEMNYGEISLQVNGHHCENLTFTNHQEDGDASQIFVQPLTQSANGKRFAFVHITNSNIAYCQYGKTDGEQLANSPFKITLPIGICEPKTCRIYKDDPKLNIGLYQGDIFWHINPINFYHSQKRNDKKYQVKDIVLSDETALVKEGKVLDDSVRKLGLLTLIGEDARFNNHLLGMTTSDKRFENITLSLQKDTQEKLQQAVNQRLQKERETETFKKYDNGIYGTAQIVATVMNAKTGEILAATDSRTDQFQKLDLTGLEVWDNNYPHTTRYLRWLPAYQNNGSHETTGSTIKLFTSLSILDYVMNHAEKGMEKLITGMPSQTANGYDGYPVNFSASTYPQYIKDDESYKGVSAGHAIGETVSMAQALKVSNNTYFAWLHEMITPALLYQVPNSEDDNTGLLKTAILPRTLSQYAIANGKTIHKLNYDAPINLLTGVPEKTTDIIPSQSWLLSPMTLDIYQGDNEYNVLNSRGQVRRAGIGVGRVHLTPIHLASLSASLSQGKTIYPRITTVSDELPMYQSQDKDLLQQLQEYKIDNQPSLHYIIEGMRQAVIGAGGTANNLNLPKVCVYAKTGTAPVGSSERHNNASITGFAYMSEQCPSHGDSTANINQHDVISFACTVRHTNSQGGTACGQLMKDFLSNYFNKDGKNQENNHDK